MLLRKDGIEIPVEKTYQSAPPGRDGTKWIIALARDSSARLHAEEALRRSQEALRDAQQVVAVAEDRHRIARDLHDTVIQRLFGAGLNLQATAANADATTRDRLETTITDLDETIKELRSAIFSLQGPSAAAPGGLRGRLLDVIGESRVGLGFQPKLRFDGPIETMDDAIADHLVPTLREALSNIARHARAHQVRVTITVGTSVTLAVVDDGAGIADRVGNGRGLTNMADRAAGLGGTFRIDPGPAGARASSGWFPLSCRLIDPTPPFARRSTEASISVDIAADCTRRVVRTDPALARSGDHPERMDCRFGRCAFWLRPTSSGGPSPRRRRHTRSRRGGSARDRTIA